MIIKKCLYLSLLFFFCCSQCFSQVKTFEFVNQNIRDILFIFSTQLEKPILADSTVTGETSFQFAGTDTAKALDAFLQANRLFLNEEDGVFYISKISVTQNVDGLLHW